MRKRYVPELSEHEFWDLPNYSKKAKEIFFVPLLQLQSQRQNAFFLFLSRDIIGELEIRESSIYLPSLPSLPSLPLHLATPPPPKLLTVYGLLLCPAGRRPPLAFNTRGEVFSILGKRNGWTTYYSKQKREAEQEGKGASNCMGGSTFTL